MCWQLYIEIVPDNASRRIDQASIESDLLSEGLRVTEFRGSAGLKYELNDGHCLCAHFRKNVYWGKLALVVAAAARNQQVKRVVAMKYWSDPPLKANLMKLDLPEFMKMDHAGELVENIRYSIRDHGKDFPRK